MKDERRNDWKTDKRHLNKRKRVCMVFDDENDAREFLKSNGYTDEDIENNGIVFETVDEEDEE